MNVSELNKIWLAFVVAHLCGCVCTPLRLWLHTSAVVVAHLCCCGKKGNRQIPPTEILSLVVQMLLISGRTYRFRSLIVLKISMKRNLYLQNSYLKIFLIRKVKMYLIQSPGFPHDSLLGFVYDRRFSSSWTHAITDDSQQYILSSIFFFVCVTASFDCSGLKILSRKRVTRIHVKCELHTRHTSTVTSQCNQSIKAISAYNNTNQIIVFVNTLRTVRVI